MRALALLLAFVVSVTAVALPTQRYVLKRAQALDSTVHLRDQPMRIRFLDAFTATALARQPLALAPRGSVDARVPFRQTVDIPVDADLAVRLDFAQAVPLRFEIAHSVRVSVSTHAEIEAMSRASFAGMKPYRGLKFRARVPVDLDLEVPIRIRYDGTAHISLQGPALLVLRQTLRVPVDELLDARIALDQRITPTLTAPLEVRMRTGGESTAILVTDAALRSTGRVNPRR